jgi:hypothetical protein
MGALVQRGVVIRFDPLPDGGSADLPGSSEELRQLGPYADVLLEPRCEPPCAGPETMGAPAQTRAVLRAAGLPLLLGGIAVLCALGIRPRA